MTLLKGRTAGRLPCEWVYKNNTNIIYNVIYKVQMCNGNRSLLMGLKRITIMMKWCWMLLNIVVFFYFIAHKVFVLLRDCVMVK